MPPATALRRAPPIEVALRAPAQPSDASVRDDAMRHAARTVGMATGLCWAVVLGTLLLWLGRVPWPEALAWSVASGAVAGRGMQATILRWLRRWFLPCTLEMGPPDAAAFRKRVPRVAARYGYALHHHALGADTFRPRWATGMLAPLRVAWSGPGACLEGPRFIVRAIAARAVDPPGR